MRKSLNILWQDELLRRYTLKQNHNRQDFEDLRSADWKYYLPNSNCKSALVFGSGLGTVPIALADYYKNISVLDSDSEKISLLKSRTKFHPSANINTFLKSSIKKLPFRSKSFDLVFWNADNSFDSSLSIQNLTKHISNYVKDDGVLCMSLQNYYSLVDRVSFSSRLINNSSIKLNQCRSLLNKFSFELICILSPLPHFKGIPLFYVPIDNSDCLNYFLRVLSVRLLGISPELKQSYKFEYFFTKIIIMVCKILPLGSIIKYFLPGYMIIAKKIKNDS